MEDPLCLLRILGGNSDVLRIVRRSFLWQPNRPQFNFSLSLSLSRANFDGAAAEHALNAEADGRDTHGRTPVLVQDGEADVAVAVDVWVAGRLAAYKRDLRGKQGRREGGREGGREREEGDCVSVTYIIEMREREWNGGRGRKYECDKKTTTKAVEGEGGCDIKI